jgi:predicted lipoprotein with Yx(FWY)xxD motif
VRRSLTIALAGAAVAAVALQVTSAMSAPAKVAAPVVVLKDQTFGRILARRDHQALYFWQVEKKAGGKIRCTGKCAKLWPPLIVKSAAVVPKHIAGTTGSFGTVRRPDGRLQVTYRKLALYTYVHEGPNQVLCNNVDGWFAVKA